MRRRNRGGNAGHVQTVKQFVAWLHEIAGIGGRIDLPRLMVLYGEFHEAETWEHAMPPEPLSEQCLVSAMRSLGLHHGTRDIKGETPYDARITMALWRARAKVVPANNRRPRVTWYDVGVPFAASAAA